MRRTDRLTGILLALQSGQRSANDLATRYDVSRRTIMRDIDALGELGVPVISVPGRNGGYRIADGFWLPSMHLTSDEATVLLFALEHIGDAARSSLGDAHGTALDEIRAILSPAVTPDVARNLQGMSVVRHPDSPDPQVIAALRKARETSEWIAITYANARAETERTILPLRVYTSGGKWYVEAADSLREERRVFRISRITSTRRILAPENADDTLRNVDASDRNYHHPDNPLIQICLTERGVELASDHRDFRNHLHETAISFRCPADELPYYGRELVRFGTSATIEGPAELRDFMLAYLSTLTSHLASSVHAISSDILE